MVIDFTQPFAVAGSEPQTFIFMGEQEGEEEPDPPQDTGDDCWIVIIRRRRRR